MKHSLFFSVIGTLLMLALFAASFGCGGSGNSPIPPSLSHQAYIKASNTGGCDQFGYSVAVGSDSLAVGACYERSAAIGVNGNQADNSAIQAGAVYVYR
jgi:hypothetical protein